MMFSSSTLPSDAWSRSHSVSLAHLSGLQEKCFFSTFHRRQFVQGISELVVMDIEICLSGGFDISVMKQA